MQKTRKLLQEINKKMLVVDAGTKEAKEVKSVKEAKEVKFSRRLRRLNPAQGG